MLIKQIRMALAKKYFLSFLLVGGLMLLSMQTTKAQAVPEYTQNEVYNYLSRMAQKGLIQFNDQIRPLSRVYLANCLDSLALHLNELTEIEKKEWAFYQQDLTDAKAVASGNAEQAKFFTKDPYNRFRSIVVNSKGFLLRVDPIITATTLSRNGKSASQTSSGFNLYGYAGKHWGFYLSLNDITESGAGLDTLRAFTPEPGVNSRIATSGRSHNYSQLRAGISYTFKNGSIGVGQDQLLWGYGENGRIILSDKAPNYPYIRFDYQPLPWLQFNYTHAWLNSDIIDSAKTYNTGNTTYGGRREFYVNKYMAQHSLTFRVKKGLTVTLGESMVYSDQINVGYLIPIMFFKVYDNLTNNENINAGSNGQLFLSVSSRNNLKNTHLYGTLFIDEVRLGTIFNKAKSRNQLGYTIGASVTDLGIPYLTAGIEYTRINPFVYRNLIPAQNYTSSSYNLGDWMGNNADRFIANLKYTPIPKLKLWLQYQYIRKGGAGSLDQQYFQEPQPPFLFNYQFSQKEWFMQASYEWFNNLYLIGNFRTQGNNQQQVNLGMRYGL